VRNGRGKGRGSEGGRTPLNRRPVGRLGSGDSIGGGGCGTRDGTRGGYARRRHGPGRTAAAVALGWNESLFSSVGSGWAR
jgi:hypothetical protein